MREAQRASAPGRRRASCAAGCGRGCRRPRRRSERRRVCNDARLAPHEHASDRARPGRPPWRRRTGRRRRSGRSSPRTSRACRRARVAEADVDCAEAARAEPFERAALLRRDRREVLVDPGHDVVDEVVLPDAGPLARVGIHRRAGDRHHRDERRCARCDQPVGDGASCMPRRSRTASRASRGGDRRRGSGAPGRTRAAGRSRSGAGPAAKVFGIRPDQTVPPAGPLADLDEAWRGAEERHGGGGDRERHGIHGSTGLVKVS